MASVWLTLVLLFVKNNWKTSSYDVCCKYFRMIISSVLCYEVPKYLTSKKAQGSDLAL